MPAMPKIASLNDLNYHHTLMDTAGVALVYFTAPDCGACKMLAQALQHYPPHEPVTVFQVDAVHNGGLINAFGIFHLPTLYLYLDGQFHAELQCIALPEAIYQAVQTALLLPPEEEP